MLVSLGGFALLVGVEVLVMWVVVALLKRSRGDV